MSPAAAPEPGVLVFDGDSVSLGYGAEPSQSPASQIAHLIPGPVRIVTTAVPGRPVLVSLEHFASAVAPHYDPKASYNIIAFHGGDNDIVIGQTAAQAYESLSRYIATAQAQGWKVIVSTECARLDFDAAARATLADYNRLELQNAAGAAAVIDYAGAAGMSDLVDRGSSGFYNADQVHPSGKGYAVLAVMLQEAIAGITKRD